jgi:hypothetical protein
MYGYRVNTLDVSPPVDIYRLVPKEICNKHKWKADLISPIMLQYYNMCEEKQHFSFHTSPSLFIITVGSENFPNLKCFPKTTIGLWLSHMIMTQCNF